MKETEGNKEDPFLRKFPQWRATLLQIAVRNGEDLELVQALARQDDRSLWDLNLIFYCIADTYGKPPDLIAHKLQILSYLISENKSFIKSSLTYFNELEHSMHEGPLVADNIHLQIIKFLVEAGADVEATFQNGTLLHLAANYMSADDFYELCRYLIEDLKALQLFKPFECSHYPKWSNPLHFLLSRDGGKALSPKTLQLILSAPDVNVNVIDGVDGNNLLLSAIRYQRDLEVIKLLISMGANIKYKNYSGRSCLHLAAEAGNVEVALYLLSLGLSVNERDIWGKTPLLLSVEHPEMIQCLISGGADIYTTIDYGNTIAHLVARSSSEVDFHTLAHFLVKVHRDAGLFRVKNECGRMPLHERLHYDRKVGRETLELLLGAREVDVNGRDEAGNTLLLLVLEGTMKNVTLARILLKHGASFKNDKRNSLCCCWK